ncbi:MAG: HlyD family secretion protein [Hyphomicrobium sp.]|uniref:efflux RND transporter periplasmic adaptor subunit n=1 Tax=Hyphomicrobium sp. TaxID=82 RepID=UPI0039E3408B
MNIPLKVLSRFAVTAVIVCFAAVAGWRLWAHYELEPWTRDGRVRADIVMIAPDVSGLVSDVLVHDNQVVHKGDVLFRIDRDRYVLALRQAEANVEGRVAALDAAKKDLVRYKNMTSIAVSDQKVEQVTATEAQAEADLHRAEADRDLAKLNLDRSEVRASVNGPITNFDLQPGNYVTAGKGVAALIDQDSLRVEGYFEETKLALIHIGDKATVHLMGEDKPLLGHVESIAGGITDRDRGSGANLLADVNPTFSWVRLAQRIPVRVALDHVPEGVRLVAGRTSTVIIEPDEQRASATASK